MKNCIIVILISCFTMSCEFVFMEKPLSKSQESVFNQVWNFTNEKYSFFDFKQVDWLKLKEKYGKTINSSMSDEQLFKVCADMLYELKDNHVNLASEFEISRNPEVFLDYPTNYNADLLERHYFDNGRIQVYDRGTFGLFDFKDVLYVRYGSFLSGVTDKAMDYIITKAADKKGIILDLRENGGGAVSNVDMIGGRFIDKDLHTGYQWTKRGPDKEDFKKDSLFLKAHKSTSSSPNYTSKPVVVLTNRGCYSATNLFVLIAKEIPNVTVLGDKTGGGGGIPATTQLTNGWTLRVSTTRTLDLSLKNAENGIEPDLKVDMLNTDLGRSKDTILEKALSFIRAK